MKRGTIGNPKFDSLAKSTGLPRYQVVGILETLWHFTCEYAPRGNIGKWSDDEIADWIGIDRIHFGCVLELLIKHRWIDQSEEHRLVVHDWHEHAGDSLKKWFVSSVQTFVTGEVTRRKYDKKTSPVKDNIRSTSELHLPVSPRSHPGLTPVSPNRLTTPPIGGIENKSTQPPPNKPASTRAVTPIFEEHSDNGKRARLDTLDGRVFAYLQLPREEGGLGMNPQEVQKAGAAIKGNGAPWNCYKLGALMYAYSQKPLPRDPVIFARGCMTGKSGARADFEAKTNRAEVMLKAWASQIAEAAHDAAHEAV
jgi:hypothetical protein